MKKLVKIIVFIALFFVILLGCQTVLHYRWAENEDVYSRNIAYEEEPADSIDVLFFGTSEIAAGFFPTAMYESNGITGVNMAVSHKSAITAYYQLKYALKHQTPKVVVCDFSALYRSVWPHKVENEFIYRKILDTMPDQAIKLELLGSITKVSGIATGIDYAFPILRYHSMWNTLTEENFEQDHVYDEAYKKYTEGCFLYTEKFEREEGDPFVVTPDLWTEQAYKEKLARVKAEEAALAAANGEIDTSNEKDDLMDEDSGDEETTEVISNLSVEYYDKFIQLCKDNDITVIAVIPPKIRDAGVKTVREETMMAYFDSRDVEVVDYNTYDEIQRLGLTLEEDYVDLAHMNYKGALILSEDFAAKLANDFGLEDHRLDNTDGKYDQWETYWEEFTADYDITE